MYNFNKCTKISMSNNSSDFGNHKPINHESPGIYLSLTRCCLVVSMSQPLSCLKKQTNFQHAQLTSQCQSGVHCHCSAPVPGTPGVHLTMYRGHISAPAHYLTLSLSTLSSALLCSHTTHSLVVHQFTEVTELPCQWSLNNK